MTHKGEIGAWRSVYGTKSIPVNSKYIYEWKFRILQTNEPDHHLFGIHTFTDGAKMINGDFSAKYMHNNISRSQFWALTDIGGKYTGKPIKQNDDSYECKWVVDDVITMILDTNKKTLSYRKNGQDFGVAFYDIILYKETYMAIAMGQYGLSIELVSFKVIT